MITLQEIRGIYERVVIDAADPVLVFAENQSAVDFDELDEYCFVRVSFGMMQEPVIGCEYMEMIRGSLVCEIFTRKNIGPGRGLEIAQPIIQALCTLNAPTCPAGQAIIAKVGPLQGPTQAQLQDRPHHFTRFSLPLYVRVPD